MQQTSDLALISTVFLCTVLISAVGYMNATFTSLCAKFSFGMNEKNIFDENRECVMRQCLSNRQKLFTIFAINFQTPLTLFGNEENIKFRVHSRITVSCLQPKKHY